VTAPETSQLSVEDSPVVMLSGVVVKVLMTGRVSDDGATPVQPLAINIIIRKIRITFIIPHLPNVTGFPPPPFPFMLEL
jgi:hypothetical protein